MKLGNTLEIANSRLSAGTTKAPFLDGVKASSGILSAQPGFVSRPVTSGSRRDVPVECRNNQAAVS